MKRNVNLGMGVLLAAAVLLGAYLGTRVDHITDSEEFFKWLISASTQIRLHQSLATTLPDQSGDQPVEYKDQELFDEINALAESALPALPESDPEEKDLPRLVQYAVPPPKLVDAGPDADLFLPDPVEQRKRLNALWQFSKSSELDPQRALFRQYLRNRQLASVGSQFDIDTIYGSGDTVVSLSNLFFGFRKMAANLLWLEADKYWHAGEYYKMLPVMHTTVKLDPNFIDAYLIGAWHLAYNATYDLPNTPPELRRWNPKFKARVGTKESFYHEAILFLLDGISKNPTSYKLYFDLGFAIYSEKMHDLPNAIKYLSMAHRQPHDSWVPRMLYRAMMQNGQYDESLAGYQRYREWALNQGRSVETVDRFIEYNKAYIQEREANQAFGQMAAAREEARTLRTRAEEARAAGDADQAVGLEQRAIELERQASEHESVANDYIEKAKQIWRTIAEREEDPLAEGRLIRIQVEDLLRRGQHVEALALLDYARWQSNELWQEFTDFILEIKQQYGVPLNLSEQKDLFRRRIAAAYEDRTINGVVFEFRDDGWYEKAYAGQPLTLLSEDSPEFSQLRATTPGLEEVLKLARLIDSYSDVADLIHLGDRVVFSKDGAWYCYVAS